MTQRNHRRQFVLCLSNRGYPASLVARRVYIRLPDPDADERALVRVIDETGQDYLYPRRLFVAIEVPREASRAFRAAS